MSSLILEFLAYRQSCCLEEGSTLIANPLLICLPQAPFSAQHHQATSSVSQCLYYMTERLHWQQVWHPKPIAWRKQ